MADFEEAEKQREGSFTDPGWSYRRGDVEAFAGDDDEPEGRSERSDSTVPPPRPERPRSHQLTAEPEYVRIIPHPGEKPAEQSPALKAAYIAGFFAIVVALIGASAQIIPKADGSTEVSCYVVIGQLRDRVRADPGFLVAVTSPDARGRPFIEQDANAQRCAIDVETLRRIAQ